MQYTQMYHILDHSWARCVRAGRMLSPGNPSVPPSYKHGGVAVGGHVALLLGFATPSTYSINGGTGKPPLFE